MQQEFDILSFDQSKIDGQETHFLDLKRQTLIEFFEQTKSQITADDLKYILSTKQQKNVKIKLNVIRLSKLKKIDQRKSDKKKMSSLNKAKLDLEIISEQEMIQKIGDICLLEKPNDLNLINYGHNMKKIQITCKLTDQTLSTLNLRNVKYLSIPCADITNEGLKMINHIPSINLYNNENITNMGLKHLSSIYGVHTLNLSKCLNITDNGLKFLNGIKVLFIDDNDAITDKGLQHLVGIQDMSIRNNHNITKDGLRYLEGIKKLRVYGCSQLKGQKLNLPDCEIYL